MKSTLWAVIGLITISVSTVFAAQPDENAIRDLDGNRSRAWRREALQSMRVAPASQIISDEVELARYQSAGFNTLVVFDADGHNDAGTAWNYKSEERIRYETEFARVHGMPLVIGMATERYVEAMMKEGSTSLLRGRVANGSIPEASDDEIRARVELWKKYGDDIVIGLFPWYDDVFWQKVTVERQRHVYEVVKGVAPQWFVFGMIGEYGLVASDDELARHFDPATFDHLIALMYPYNVGSRLIGVPLDNLASSNPDADISLYVDDFVARMNDRFFRHLRGGQLILLVVQAFHYRGEPDGRIPRPNDVTIMMSHGSKRLRALAGQDRNFSIACYWWGEEGSEIIGLKQRPDWIAAAQSANAGVAEEGRVPVRNR